MIDTSWTDQNGNSWSVRFDWELIEHYAQVCGVSIKAVDHDAPLTTRILREIPMGKLEKQVRALIVKNIKSNKKDVFRVADKSQPSVSVAEIKRVADLHAQAMNKGESAHQTILSTLNISYPTASRRIRLAKDMGLITND